MALTRFDGIQLSVCNEAVGARKPMLASDTRLLQQMFPRGSVFVHSQSPHDLARGVSEVRARFPELREEMERFCEERKAIWWEKQGQPLLIEVYRSVRQFAE
jgi:hypothetical protein